MAADLASLGLAVDTSQLESANKSLGEFAQSGKSAQISADVLVASAVRLGISVQEVERRLAAANDNMADSAAQAMKLSDATKQLSAANDNLSGSLANAGSAANNAGRGFFGTIEHALNLTAHLKLLALGAYALSPAFRSIVNTGISKFFLEVIPASGLAQKAISGLITVLSPALSFFVSIGAPILAAVAAFEVLSSVWSKGSALLDKYANSLRQLYAAGTDQSLASLTRGQQDIISAEQVARATELGVRLQDASFIIKSFLTSSIFDLTNVSLKLQAVWVAFVEVVARVAQYIQLIPTDKLLAVAKAAGNAALNVVPGGAAIGAAISTVSSLTPNAPKADDTASIQAATGRLSAMMGVAALATETLNKTTNAVGELDKEFNIGTSFIARYSDDIQKLQNGIKDTDSWDRVVRSIERQTASLEANAASVGESSKFHESLRVELQLLNASTGGLNAVTDEQTDKFVELRTKGIDPVTAAHEAGIKIDEKRIQSMGKLSEAAGNARQELDKATFAIANQKALDSNTISLKALTAYSAAQKGAIAAEQTRLQLQDDLNKKRATQEQVDERAAAAAKLASDTELKALSEAARARALAADQTVKTSQVAITAIGKSVGETYRLTTIEQTRQQLEQDASQRHTTLNEKELAQLTEKINKTAALKQAEAERNAQSDADFERQTVFLTEGERKIAELNRRLHGDDWKNYTNDALSNQMRITDGLKDVAQGFQDVGKAMFSAFLSGKNVMDAMVQSLDNIAKKLADKAFENLLVGVSYGNLVQVGLGAAQAGASALISLFTGDQKAKKALQEAQDAWKKMADQVTSFNAAAKGFQLGPLTQALVSLNQALLPLAEAAYKAHDYAAVTALQTTFNQGVVRLVNEFQRGTQTLTPYAQALKDLNDEAQGLIDTLNSENLQGAAGAVAAALPDRIAALTKQYTDQLVSDLTNRLNAAQGKDYLNSAVALVAQHNADIAAAQQLGVSMDLVDQTFRASAQKLVDDAGLTGAAFDELLAKFPQLAGVVQATAQSIQRSADQIAQARQSYQDQLFALQQDQTTLAGQLAVFDRQAEEARATEVAQGGQALVDLEALQAAQRLKIINDYNQQQLQAQIQAAQQFQSFINQLTNTIKTFVDSLSGGANSILSPLQRLQAAQSQYNSQLALAQAGNQDAANSITQYAGNLISAEKSYYGSSQPTQDAISQISSQLNALPSQISATQQIVNAINSQTAALQAAFATGDASSIAAALLPSFNQLTANTNGLLSFAQFQQIAGGLADTATLHSIFNTLDTDGSGQINRLELIKASTANTDSNTAPAKLADKLHNLYQNISDTASYQAKLLQDILASVNGAYNFQQTNLPYLGTIANNTGYLSSINNYLAGIYNAYTSAGGDQLNRIRANLAQQNLKQSIPAYATGTDFAPGGMAWVGERGPELMNVPRGAQIIPNHRVFSNDNVPLLDAINALRREVAAMSQRMVSAQVMSAQEMIGGIKEIAYNTKVKSKVDRRAA